MGTRRFRAKVRVFSTAQLREWLSHNRNEVCGERCGKRGDCTKNRGANVRFSAVSIMKVIMPKRTHKLFIELDTSIDGSLVDYKVVRCVANHLGSLGRADRNRLAPANRTDGKRARHTISDRRMGKKCTHKTQNLEQLAQVCSAAMRASRRAFAEQ